MVAAIGDAPIHLVKVEFWRVTLRAGVGDLAVGAEGAIDLVKAKKIVAGKPIRGSRHRIVGESWRTITLNG